MVPENFFQAFFEQYETEIIQVETKPGLSLDPKLNGTETKLVGRYVDGPNMLGLVIWSFAIGIMLNRVGQEARITVEAIQCLNDAIKIIVNWILWYLPIGVMFLITEHVLEVTDWDAVLKLTKLVGVVFAGLAVQAFVIFPVLYFILTRRNPFLIFKHISRALTTAFIIASSAATLPVTLQCCEENVKVDKKLCRLMLPIVTSINRTGMAFYEVVATVFVAQLHDITLEVGQIIAIGLSSAIITFGSVGIPQTGAVTTILILTAVGLPAEDAAILVGVEWILDHFITVVNVLVNVFGVAITNHVWHDDLITLDKIPSLDEPRPSKDIELDLSFLESDEEFIPPVSASPTRSNSPRRGYHRNIVTPTS
ncbi:PREDICTED: excitatory amino acid transporter 3-like isoform X1 [Poecilia mexicana]|uniref:excitatory amino acid transporter 3-like isoform X1 n=1 Tax=Poecilia mexicana TaxID=48701 RepID=UPI00072EC17E|nr:PREDICTED: excitatory amino acid transporter 3-like isoform X1 [Poecilia mexicana]